MALSLTFRYRLLRPFGRRRSLTAFPFRPRTPLNAPPTRRPSALCVQNLSSREMGSIVFSTVLSGMLIFSPPTFADVKTVPANEVSALAKPLPVEKVEKKRVWLVFVVGAASLFVFINVIENNPAWFPSVARANKAMTARRKQRIQQIELQNLAEAESEAARLTASVERGLAEAKKRRLAQNASKNRTSETPKVENDAEFILQRDKEQS